MKCFVSWVTYEPEGRGNRGGKKQAEINKSISIFWGQGALPVEESPGGPPPALRCRVPPCVASAMAPRIVGRQGRAGGRDPREVRRPPFPQNGSPFSRRVSRPGRTEVAAHDAVPGRVVLFVELLLDEGGDILLNVVLLQGLIDGKGRKAREGKRRTPGEFQQRPWAVGQAARGAAGAERRACVTPTNREPGAPGRGGGADQRPKARTKTGPN